MTQIESKGSGFPYDEAPSRSREYLRVLSREFSNAALFWVFQSAGWTLFGAVMFAWGISYWSATEAFVNKALLVITTCVSFMALLTRDA